MGLEFYDRGHVYMLDGERIPCVSDLCRFLHREVYKDAPSWQMEAAADRGTKVHAATEALDGSGRAEIEDEYLPYLQAYAAFLSEHEVQWELTEQSMYHPEHKYAGTIDRYGKVDGVLTLLDIKTTYRVMKPLCLASLNLYRMMLEARGKTAEQLMILHLKKDGTYKLVKIDMDDQIGPALIKLNNLLKPKRRKNGIHN
jgi:genome maintenance exonuclease 1